MTRPVMNMSTASTGYGYSVSSRSGSAFKSSPGSGTGYNSGSKTGTGSGSGSGSIGPSIYGEVIIPTTAIKEEEKRIQQFQEQLRESNKAQFAIIGGAK
jgi:hypothetical protein